MTGVEHVKFERERQITKGFNDQAPENADCQLVECADYILGDYMEDCCLGSDTLGKWPVERAIKVKHKYGKDYVARLRIAAALIAAEIDRIQQPPAQPEISGDDAVAYRRATEHLTCWPHVKGCTCVACFLSHYVVGKKPALPVTGELEQLKTENQELVTLIYSLLDAGKLAQWPDDVATANWGISALAAKTKIESSTYAKTVQGANGG